MWPCLWLFSPNYRFSPFWQLCCECVCGFLIYLFTLEPLWICNDFSSTNVWLLKVDSVTFGRKNSFPFLSNEIMFYRKKYQLATRFSQLTSYIASERPPKRAEMRSLCLILNAISSFYSSTWSSSLFFFYFFFRNSLTLGWWLCGIILLLFSITTRMYGNISVL